MVLGLKVNFAKSNVIGINIDDSVLREISHFFTCNIGSVPFKFFNMGLNGSSIWWRDLITLGADNILEKVWLKEVVKNKLGKGDTIKFWADSWLGREPLKRLFPSLFSLCKVQEASIAEMGIWQHNGWCWNWL